MHPERAQAGAFLPKLLEQAGLLKEATSTKGAEKDAMVSVVTVLHACLLRLKGSDFEREDAEKAEEDRKQAVMQRYAETDKAISELNVILVYKKVVQGLIYSPPDCDKYLALDAKPQGLSSVAPDSGPTLAALL